MACFCYHNPLPAFFRSSGFVIGLACTPVLFLFLACRQVYSMGDAAPTPGPFAALRFGEYNGI